MNFDPNNSKKSNLCAWCNSDNTIISDSLLKIKPFFQEDIYPKIFFSDEPYINQIKPFIPNEPYPKLIEPIFPDESYPIQKNNKIIYCNDCMKKSIIIPVFCIICIKYYIISKQIQENKEPINYIEDYICIKCNQPNYSVCTHDWMEHNSTIFPKSNILNIFCIKCGIRKKD